MKRIFIVGVLCCLAGALLLFLGDALAFQVKVRKGTAYDTVQVNQFLLTPLKGQKEEYDVVGQAPMACAKTIFPQSSTPACWWLRRHANQWQ